MHYNDDASAFVGKFVKLALVNIALLKRKEDVKVFITGRFGTVSKSFLKGH